MLDSGGHFGSSLKLADHRWSGRAMQQSNAQAQGEAAAGLCAEADCGARHTWIWKGPQAGDACLACQAHGDDHQVRIL